MLARAAGFRTPRTASLRPAEVGYFRGVDASVQTPVSGTEPQAIVEGELLPSVDAVIVSYRSAATLRGCVEPLTRIPHVRVTVVDNASPDESVDTIADLPVEVVRSARNGGFSYGCNLGAARGTAPFLLFLNPDARIDPDALESLVAVFQHDPATALVGPRLLDEDGKLAWSQRRFPRHRSTFGLALFAHRLWPRAAWSDELIRDAAAYDRPGTPEWVSGACMLVRRTTFEQLGGFDERFFLYCEDTDLCRRVWDAGQSVRFEPSARVWHVGGASSAVGETQPIAATSRVLYARKHMGRSGARVEAVGVALGEVTRAVAKLRQRPYRKRHLEAFRAALSPDQRWSGRGSRP
jgi:N-acetylglucosaminyl-diphospho-decaprenol L-rhamnosyltransferase